jgi:hypothetical protein
MSIWFLRLIVYFVANLYILWQIGNFMVIWYIFPVLVRCTKKNLATPEPTKTLASTAAAWCAQNHYGASCVARWAVAAAGEVGRWSE